jgi:hypothetical protein
MSDQPASHQSADEKEPSGFMRAAVTEWKRKWNRRKLSRRLAKGEAKRVELLTAVGQTAWSNRIRAPQSEAVWERLTALSGQSGTVEEGIRQKESLLQEQQEVHQKAQKRWSETLEEASETRARRQEAYDSVHETVLKQQQTARTTRSKLDAVHKELAILRDPKSASDAPGEADPAQQIATLEEKNRQLSGDLAQVDSYLQGVQPEEAKLLEQLEQATAQHSRLSEQQQAELTALKKNITDTEQQLRNLSGQQRDLSGKLSGAYAELGQLVASEGSTAPPLQESLGQLRNHDEATSSLASAMAASLEASRRMPRGTMAKFYFTVIGIPALLFIFIIGGVAGFRTWQSWSQARAAQATRETVPQAPISPYLNHALDNHPAYRLADRLAAARVEGDRQTAEKALLEMCRTIHLGIYTMAGEQVLSGAERNDQDFFLYDFQRKTLARSFVNRNVTEMKAHNRLIAKLILKIGQVNQFDKAFREVLVQRYEDAAAEPDRPENFLPLLIDGLARHQVTPYSTGELTSRSTARLDVDDVQSFLIILDFFIPSPPPHRVVASNWSDFFTTPAYAGSLCDEIAGKEEQGYWEGGSPLLPTVLGQLPGRAAETAAEAVGSVTDVLGILGDILILRGIQLEIQPSSGHFFDLPHTKKKRSDKSLPTYKFTAVATFEVEISEEAAKCGWMVGKAIPKNGPLKEVEITWDFKPPLVGDWRTDIMGSSAKVMLHDKNEFIANMRMLTDDTGRATITLRAMPCPHPDGQEWVSEHYQVMASGRYVSAQVPNPLAALGGPASVAIGMLPGFYEVVTGGRKAYNALDVSWHEETSESDQY